jgi:hypothetical protein
MNPAAGGEANKQIVKGVHLYNYTSLGFFLKFILNKGPPTNPSLV